MRVTHTKQFPFFYYGLISFIIAALMLVSGHRFGLHAVDTNHQPPYTTVSSSAVIAHAPAICNISADDTIVKCGISTILTADPGFNPTWSNGATTPSITVTTSGQYWWEYVDLNHNSVTNGDFSSGNTGFTSDYTYIAPNGTTGPYGALSAEGYYSVTTSPGVTHTSFANFPDHTNGNGKMMVINGSPLNNAKVWKQNITVEPNTGYVFSIWGASAHPANPAKLTFSINGTQLGVIQLSTTTGQWQNFTVQWTSDASTSASIAIVNQNTIASGNDFALDDIVFAPVCRKNFNVTLYPNPPKPGITSL